MPLPTRSPTSSAADKRPSSNLTEMSSRRSLADIFRAAYAGAKKPTAFLLVVLAGVGSVLPMIELQVAALVACGAIALEVLFDLRKSVSRLFVPHVFADFFETTAAMRDEILSRLDHDRRVTIKAMGLSMGHAWPFLINSLTNRFRAGSEKIDLQIAMLDPSWPELTWVNPDWAARARTNIDEIERYAELLRPVLTSSGSTISLSVYAYMPNWHGVLINDEVLFLSTCFWRNGCLTGAENRYELLFASDPHLGAPRTSQFRSWFDRIMAAPTTKNWP